MKRSQINALMQETVAFLDEQNFKLPPFAFWGPDVWATKGPEADEIRDCMLGWDLTDFGSGDFARIGLILFTIRNGHHTDLRYRHKPYCEKALIVDEGQVTPMHFHWSKVEDIIVRAGGNLAFELYGATEDDGLSNEDATVSVDGELTKVKAGGRLVLAPGQSVCLPARLYHKFWGEPGRGKVLVGEVSKVNDDRTDNRFHEPVGRFPQIEEDEEPLYLLCTEYPR
jgi:hypothetical protein